MPNSLSRVAGNFRKIIHFHPGLCAYKKSAPVSDRRRPGMVEHDPGCRPSPYGRTKAPCREQGSGRTAGPI